MNSLVRLQPLAAGRVDLVIERPQRANALSGEVAAALLAALREITRACENDEALAPVAGSSGSDQSPRVVVLRGAGKHFCAGADLEEMAELTPVGAERFIRSLHRALHAIRTLPVPVVAQVRGAALGAGLEMLVSCDLAIVGESALLGMPEPHVGLPSVIEAALLPGIVGLGRAREMLLLGDNFGGQEALEMGLVNRVVPEDQLEAAVHDVVARLTRHPREALALQKDLLNRWLNLPLDEAVEAGVRTFAMAMASAEPGERMRQILNHGAADSGPKEGQE